MTKLVMLGLLVTTGFASANNLNQNEKMISEVKKNDVVYEFTDKPEAECSVSVTYYSPDGVVIGKEVYSEERSSLISCMAYQNATINFLKACGYRVEILD